MEEYMDILAILIPILIAVIGDKASKKKKAEKNKKHKKNSTNTSNIFQSQNTTSIKTLSAEAEKWRTVAKENIEKARGRVDTEVLNRMFTNQTNSIRNLEISRTLDSKTLKGNTSKQTQQRSIDSQHTGILGRAKENVKGFEKDVTLHTMELEHAHSERVAPAIHTHNEDILAQDILGNVSDLMVKGYDGNLCFERDFVGEAMDMISNFNVPTEVPEFSFPEI